MRTRWLVTVGTVLLTTYVAAPAQATPHPALLTHPDADHLGSTIRAHEPAHEPTSSHPTAGPVADGTIGDPTDGTAGDPTGIDVSHFQGAIDWPSLTLAGVSFAYLKATEGVTFVDPTFATNNTGAAAAGIPHGAYHFALPDRSSGAAQANYFLANGAGWTADGRTLPPVIDIEYNPYNPQALCYGLTPGQMTAWLLDFATTIDTRIGRWPVIYSTTNWWAMCTGNTPALAAHCPLWIAHYNAVVGPLPNGWRDYTFWQHADSAPNLPGDQDYFNGSTTDLQAFALGVNTGNPLGLP